MKNFEVSRLWILSLLIIGASIAFAFNLHRSAASAFNDSSFDDFPNYYVAGRLLLSGQSVYRNFPQAAETMLGHPYPVYPADSPATVVLLSPLSLLPYKTAWWVFALFSSASIFAASFIAAKTINIPPATSLLLAAFSLLTMPALFLLRKNHMESILVLLSVLGWNFFKRDKPYWGAALWGIAGALKLFPFIWLISLVRVRSQREIAFGFLCGAIVSLLGVFTVGIHDSIFFVTDIIPRSAEWYGVIGNLSLLSFGTALRSHLFGIIMATIGAAVWLVQLCCSRRTSLDSRWFSGIGWSLLLSPLGWVNYFVLLIAPLIVSVAPIFNGRKRWLLSVTVVSLLFWPALISTPLPLGTVVLSHVPTMALAILLIFPFTKDVRSSPL